MTDFLHILNFRETRLDGAITATATKMRVSAGDGDAQIPDVHTVLTLSVDKSLNEMKRSERVRVLAKTTGDTDELTIVRNYNNPYNITETCTVNGAHILGATTLNLSTKYF